MKRYLLLVMVGSILSLLFTSCVKELNPGNRINNKVAGCPIRQLFIQSWLSPYDTLTGLKTITYNTAGNPVDLLSASGNLPYLPSDYHFRYDRWGRLTDYYTNYTGNIGAVVWHRYSYPDDQTVVDSIFDYVGLIDDPEPPHYSSDMYLHIFKLDGKGRIIRDYPINMTDPGLNSYTGYTYDANGNLVRDGVTYDRKINPYQTNYAWMFVFQDFSMNNPSLDTYNTPVIYTDFDSRGLPVKIKSGISNPEANLFNYSYLLMNIKYGCDEGAHSIQKAETIN